MKSIEQRIAEELGVRPNQVQAAVELLDGGSTVPFIARYRKEVTGMLDDTQLRTLEERLRYLRELEERRAAILDSIREQGKLDDALKRDHRRRTEGAARRHLSAVQAEAPHEGADRARGGARAAGRRAARRSDAKCRDATRRRSSTPKRTSPTRRPRSTARATFSSSASPKRRSDRQAARGYVGPRPPRVQSARRQEGHGGRREIRRLFRLLRAASEACLRTAHSRCSAARRRACSI